MKAGDEMWSLLGIFPNNESSIELEGAIYVIESYLTLR